MKKLLLTLSIITAMPIFSTIPSQDPAAHDAQEPLTFVQKMQRLKLTKQKKNVKKKSL